MRTGGVMPAAARMARVRVLVIVALSLAGFGSRGSARAQTSDPGAVSVAGGVDLPAVYILRGVVQEGEPRLTVTPQVNVRIPLSAGGRVEAVIGLWNSFNTGTSGSGGPLQGPRYAELLSVSLSVGGPRGLVLTPGYLLNNSGNGGFAAIHELSLTVARPGRLAPYALVAFELSDMGQVDEGAKAGRYLEFGAVPSIDLPVGRLRLTTPVRTGVSLGNYYELFERDLRFRDHRFGFVEAGGHLHLPVSSSASWFGAWSVHGGADVFVFGESTRAFNRGRRSRVVGTVGVSFAY
jgi:hypothetical protein